jgi:hypothetical protein
MEVNTIISKLELRYYANLINNLVKNNINYEWLNNHHIKLKNNINDELTETQTDNSQKKENSINCKECEQCKNEKNNKLFSSDDTYVCNDCLENNDLYKKPWTKLNQVHKILKIKEFVNTKNITSEKHKEELKDKLIELVKLKILSKKENVKYNETEGRIIELPHLEYKDGKYSHP